MQMIKINAKIKQETLDALKDEAEKDGRTDSGMIRKILEDYFKEDKYSFSVPHSGNIALGEIVNFVTEN